MFHIISDVKFAGTSTNQGSYDCDVTMPIKYLKYKAVPYELGDLIFHQNQAFKIEEIVNECDTEEVLLYSKKLNFVFVSHLGFFKILSETSDIYQTLKISDLLYAPVNIHTISNERFFKLKYF